MPRVLEGSAPGDEQAVPVTDSDRPWMSAGQVTAARRGSGRSHGL